MAGDSWDDAVSSFLSSARGTSGARMSDRAFVTLPGVFKALGIALERQGRGEQARVVSILKRMKWERRLVRTGQGMREYRYLAPLEDDDA